MTRGADRRLRDDGRAALSRDRHGDAGEDARAKFVALRLGPVVMKDEVEYFREVGLLEPVRVTLALAAMSEDAGRFVIRNELFRTDGRLAARVNSTVGWLDLVARRLMKPPPELFDTVNVLPRTADFRSLSSDSR